MNELWRRLKLGDRVKITGWPVELNRELLHAETISLYDHLIDSEMLLTVEKIDNLGIPFAAVELKVDGVVEWHSIAVNHDAVEIGAD